MHEGVYLEKVFRPMLLYDNLKRLFDKGNQDRGRQDLRVKEEKPAADIDERIDYRCAIKCLFSSLKQRIRICLCINDPTCILATVGRSWYDIRNARDKLKFFANEPVPRAHILACLLPSTTNWL